MTGLRWKPGKSLVISVYRENLRFLIYLNLAKAFDWKIAKHGNYRTSRNSSSSHKLLLRIEMN